VRPTRWRRVCNGVVRVRARIRQQNSLNLAYRITVGVVGGLVLVIGIVTIPYPGPGWLTVFAGLGILATEFDWARRLLHRGRRHYEAWRAWVRRRPPAVRLVVLAATGTLVIATLWLVGAFGILARLLWLPWPWLQSPIG
jgi:uncharacterized protein (TIGR02611 family)